MAVVNGTEIRSEDEIPTQKCFTKATSNSIQLWVSACILPFENMS